MQFSFGKDPTQGLIIGLHPFQNLRVVFDLGKCFLQSELSNQIVDWIRDFARRENLEAYDIKEHMGFLRYLAIREAKDKAEIMVNLITYYEKFKKSENFASGLLQHFPSIKSVVQNVNPKLATIAFGEKEILLGGNKTIREKISKLYFEISANSFFQTNSKQAERLFDIIIEFTDLEGSEKVLDLYSGTGAISLLLSGKAKEVIGIEAVKDSIDNAQRNAELNSIENCRFFQGEAKEVLSSLVQEGYSPEIVVVDPPRGGMHKKVVSSVLKLNPERIIYVSCNPSTLARDLKILCEKDYILEKVQPIDMFPQTYHIESVAKLIKKRLA